MSRKPVEKYTNEELKRAIKLVEDDIEFEKKIRNPDKEAMEQVRMGMEKKQRWLEELHKERSRRFC